ncbi:acyl-CoA dehydrogenase family protein [Novosphingobium ginsenosidimutans]|uniref:acyl-CoA dehydrogenase family protein n=1 Tax=Novosphingobium ginsenosidimutans TaxID=1176536 RepID=UPI00307E7882
MAARARCPGEQGCLLKLLEQVGEHDAPFWDTAVEQGWTALAVPEEHGGLGLGWSNWAWLPRRAARLRPVRRS